jgi:hypothetical protein
VSNDHRFDWMSKIIMSYLYVFGKKFHKL